MVQTPKNAALILIVDADPRRRSVICDAFAPTRVIETISLHDAYSLLEELQPGTLLLSETAVRESGLPMFVRLAQAIGARWVFYGGAEVRGAATENRTCPPEDWVAVSAEGGAEQLVTAVRKMNGLPGDPVSGSGCGSDISAAQTLALAQRSTLAQRSNHAQTSTLALTTGPGASAASLPRSGRAIASAKPRPEIIVIGASTGGINAIETLLAEFPADCPPTLIVQHIRPGFIDGMIRRLSGNCRTQILAARNGAAIQRGTVYIAAEPGYHLQLGGGPQPRLRLVQAPEACLHRPSVDALFESAASYAPAISAALLTGMGADGALGMAAIRAAGGFTVAQDRASSAVYGMPRVAAETGAACAVLPLERIASALLAGVAPPQWIAHA